MALSCSRSWPLLLGAGALEEGCSLVSSALSASSAFAKEVFNSRSVSARHWLTSVRCCAALSRSWSRALGMSDLMITPYSFTSCVTALCAFACSSIALSCASNRFVADLTAWLCSLTVTADLATKRLCCSLMCFVNSCTEVISARSMRTSVPSCPSGHTSSGGVGTGGSPTRTIFSVGDSGSGRHPAWRFGVLMVGCNREAQK